MVVLSKSFIWSADQLSYQAHSHTRDVPALPVFWVVIHLFIHLFIYSFIHSFILFACLFIHFFVHSFIHSSIHQSICSSIHSIVHSLIPLLIGYSSSSVYCFSVDRNKYQIHIPLPPKIDPTVTMMQVGYVLLMMIDDDENNVLLKMTWLNNEN